MKIQKEIEGWKVGSEKEKIRKNEVIY